MALNNCTINSSSVTVTKDAVLGATAHQVLTITPNTGYVVQASDFANNSGTVTGITSIALSNSGTAYAENNTVLVTCDLDNTYTAAGNATFTIDIDGDALDIKGKPYTLAGTWDQIVNANVVASPVTGASGNAYSASGTYLEEDIIIEQTYTCASGYYFSTDPVFTKSSVGIYADNYLVEKTYLSFFSGTSYPTAIKYKVTWKNPGADVSGHNLDFSEGSVTQPGTQANLITGFVINTDGLSSSGETRTLKIYGNSGSSFRIFIRDDGATDPADTWYNFTTDLFSGSSESYSDSFEIDSTGIYEMDIIFPAQDVNPTETYFISIIGGTSPATNTTQGSVTNNDAFTQTLTQVDDISITLVAAGTALNVSTSVGGTNAIQNIPANSVNVDSNGNMLGGDVKWDILVTSTTPGKVLHLLRQPVFTEDTAYNTGGTMDFSNGLASGNNGTIWHIENLEATGTATATIRIQTGTSTNSAGNDVNGFFWDTSGTASVTSSLNLDNFINIPPVAAPATYNGTEDVNLECNLAASATANGGTLTYAIVVDNTGSNGTLTLNTATGVATFDNTLNWNGTTTFTWKCNDGSEDSNTTTATMVLAPVADALTAVTLVGAGYPNTPENSGAGFVVGTLGTTDVDGAGTYTYSLVSGTGSNDNGRFQLTGASNQNLGFQNDKDYENPDDDDTNNTYQVRVRSTRSDSLYVETAFVVTVTDVVEGTARWEITMYDAAGSATGAIHYTAATQYCNGGSFGTIPGGCFTLNKFVRLVTAAGGCSSSDFGGGKITNFTASTGTPTAYIKNATWYNSSSDSHGSTGGTSC